MQAPTLPQQASRRSAVVIEDRVTIPAWVDDLESFRRWARSGEMPERGWFAYLHGEVWVDLTMEQLFTHNRVKTEFTVVLGGLVKTEGKGYFFSDRTLFSSPEADLSTEPDALFVSYDAVRGGRVRWVEGAEEGYVEVEGTPDMVLEIISKTSVRKDTITLRELYWRAGVREYWLVDARGASPQFDILRHTAEGYVAAEAREGWLRSEVFGREFQLTQHPDPLGQPQYALAARASGGHAQ
ncbi:MAG: Uma2 family endonuclease [Abditibacteriales bacterium]|nr:Uma2 family endonuclease [Abditibacteriales bacterium]